MAFLWTVLPGENYPHEPQGASGRKSMKPPIVSPVIGLIFSRIRDATIVLQFFFSIYSSTFDSFVDLREERYKLTKYLLKVNSVKKCFRIYKKNVEDF